MTANVTPRKERTGKVLLWSLAVLLIAVLGFAGWVTTLLVRASRAKDAAAAASGKPPEEFDPWKNNPYTATTASGSAAPGAPPKP